MTFLTKPVDPMHLNAPKFQHFSHDGLQLAYFDEGDPAGRPVLLIHGFASSALVNWVHPGWLQTLASAGRRVIAIDNRGHGASDKPHDPAAYHPSRMAGDAAALLDHLGIGMADVFGYSMGARIAAFLAVEHSDKVRSLVWGGLGIRLVRGSEDWDPIAAALLAPSLDDVTNARGRMFRSFADKTGSDRFALAACISSNRVHVSEAAVSRIMQPVLIGVGTDDDLAGSAEELADMLPDGRAVHIPGRDHMLAVGDRAFKKAVLDFYDDIAAR
jgi:pimeloyl-ACP methyl ester carboxylesterase